MQLENLILFMIYLFSSIAMFNFSSFILAWMFMELNLSLFCLMLILFSNSNKFALNECFFYLVVQGFSSFIFIIGTLSNFTTAEMGSSFFFIVSMCIKLGMAPFHHWFYKFSHDLSKTMLFISLTFQKFPFIFIFSILDLESVSLILIFNLLIGMMKLYYSLNISEFLVSSSIYFMAWNFVFLNFSYLMAFFNIFLYSLVVYIFCTKYQNFFHNYTLFSDLNWFNCSMYFFSLPPFNMFFFKLYVISFINSYLSILFSLLIWIPTFLSLGGYFFFIYKMIVRLPKLYSNFCFKKFDYVNFLFFVFFGFMMMC